MDRQSGSFMTVPAELLDVALMIEALRMRDVLDTEDLWEKERGAFYATRLYRDLREDAGLVYSVEVILDAGRTRSLFGISYACDPPNVSRVRAIIIRQVPLAQSSLDGIAGELLRLSQEGLPLDEPTIAAKRYRDLTAEEVREAFARWIRPNDFAQVTVGPVSK